MSEPRVLYHEDKEWVLKSYCDKLKAQLWVAKDSQLRTYDGLTEKADKYDELAERCARYEAALREILNQKMSLYVDRDSLCLGIYQIAMEALAHEEGEK